MLAWPSRTRRPLRGAFSSGNQSPEDHYTCDGSPVFYSSSHSMSNQTLEVGEMKDEWMTSSPQGTDSIQSLHRQFASDSIEIVSQILMESGRLLSQYEARAKPTDI